MFNFFFITNTYMYIQEKYLHFPVNFTKPSQVVQWYKYRISEITRYYKWFPANLMCVSVCAHLFVCQFLLGLLQLRLSVFATAGCALYLIRTWVHVFLLSQRLQLGSAIGHGSMDGVSLLPLQLTTKKDEAGDADEEWDCPQAQCQAQIRYPERMKM